jgi:hypothetical protein
MHGEGMDDADAADADAAGVGFVRLRALPPKCAEIPDLPGIYAVTLEARMPAFLARSVGGRFKGKDPTVSLAAIDAKWLDGTETGYAGRALSLRDRLGLLARFGRGDPSVTGADATCGRSRPTTISACPGAWRATLSTQNASSSTASRSRRVGFRSRTSSAALAEPSSHETSRRARWIQPAGPTPSHPSSAPTHGAFRRAARTPGAPRLAINSTGTLSWRRASAHRPKVRALQIADHPRPPMLCRSAWSPGGRDRIAAIRCLQWSRTKPRHRASCRRALEAGRIP